MVLASDGSPSPVEDLKRSPTVKSGPDPLSEESDQREITSGTGVCFSACESSLICESKSDQPRRILKWGHLVSSREG